MFERYTEAARRTLFYARFETTELGGVAIETEHILLGLLRQREGILTELFKSARLSYDEVRAQVQARPASRDKGSPAVEIPFSPETKRVLQLGAEEADRFNHNYIGREHLLLGLLREPGSMAASILTSHGLTPQSAREHIVQQLAKGPPHPDDPKRNGPSERISAMRHQLREIELIGLDGARDVIARIHRDLDELERLFCG